MIKKNEKVKFECINIKMKIKHNNNKGAENYKIVFTSVASVDGHFFHFEWS